MKDEDEDEIRLDKKEKWMAFEHKYDLHKPLKKLFTAFKVRLIFILTAK